MVKVNLIPDVVLKRRREARIRQMSTIGLIAWGILVGATAAIGIIYQLVQTQRLRLAEKQRTELDAQVNSPANVAFRKEAQEVQASLIALDGLINNQKKSTKIFTRLASLIPKGVQLKDINLTADKLSFSGKASSYAQAGEMVAALKQTSPTDKDIYFTNVKLGGASVSDAGVSFEISAKYVYVKAAI